jgi:hypothetical protein
MGAEANMQESITEHGEGGYRPEPAEHQPITQEQGACIIELLGEIASYLYSLRNEFENWQNAY